MSGESSRLVSLIYWQLYHYANRDEILIKKKEYRASHAKEIDLARKEWRERNRERHNKNERERYQRNIVKMRERRMATHYRKYGEFADVKRLSVKIKQEIKKCQKQK